MRVYRLLGDALRDGFTVYDKTGDGYIVRRYNQSSQRWELAIVDLTKKR